LKQRTKDLLIEMFDVDEKEGPESKKLEEISLELAEIISSDRAEEEEVKKYLDAVFDVLISKPGSS
jgi:hypothetical protein